MIKSCNDLYVYICIFYTVQFYCGLINIVPECYTSHIACDQVSIRFR